MKRRYAILAHGQFGGRGAKTAHGVIAYGNDSVAVVIDRLNSGRSVRDVVPYLSSNAPIVDSLSAAMTFKPTALLVGVAPSGGALPSEWRTEISEALASGMEVVNGLHYAFTQDPAFVAAASRGGARIWDVRTPPDDIPLFSGLAWETPAQVLLTVGSDCAVGKMTVSLELERAARNRGRKSKFVPTGQTGIMIAGWGIAIDRVIADFAAGAAEKLVLEAAPDHDLLIVEGQGSITHPAYAGVTMALLYGSAPDALVLVHDLGRHVVEPYKTPILRYTELITAYELLCASVKPARVIGIALNTSSLDEPAARRAIREASLETSLPCDDVVRFGPLALWNAIENTLGNTKGSPLRNVASKI